MPAEMSPKARWALALMSMWGFGANAFLYALSLSGMDVDVVFPWTGLSVIGALLVSFPMNFVERFADQRTPPFLRGLKFFYCGFARNMPSWVAPGEWVLAITALVHLACFFLHSGWGVPAIRDGQYVIDSHGQILRALTQQEYLMLKREALRMIAAMMISIYFVPMMYWWHRRDGQAAERAHDPGE